MSESKTNTQSIPVTPGEISVGDHITVMEWNEQPNPFEKLQEQGFTAMQVSVPLPGQSQALMGDVLEIKALSLPYILVQNHSDLDDGHVWETIDTREMRYKLLQPEFVQAVKENAITVKIKKDANREEAFAMSQRMADIQHGHRPPPNPTIITGGELADLLTSLGGLDDLDLEEDEEPVPDFLREANDEIIKRFMQLKGDPEDNTDEELLEFDDDDDDDDDDDYQLDLDLGGYDK